MKAMRQFAMCAIMMIVTSGLLAQFQEVPLSIPGFQNGSLAWGDYDNDGDLDILLSGQNSAYITRIYRNDGNNTFVDINAGFIGTESSPTDWGDFDNDGDLDFIISGYNATQGIYTKVYRNDGNGSFTDINAGLLGVMLGSVKWGDYDNDGFLDILLTGSVYQSKFTKLYRNNRDSTFSEVTIGILGYTYSAVDWGDYDNDGDLDILIAGDSGGDNTEIYRNDGEGIFVSIQTPMMHAGITNGAASWGDFDNDGFLDVLVTGNMGSYSTSKIFKNTGNDVFIDTGAGLMNVFYATSCWGDYDNDGFLDIFMAGATGTGGGLVAKIYNNVDGIGFYDINAPVNGADNGDSAWSDYDNDGDLDILYSGGIPYGATTKLYENTGTISNIPPTMPSNLNLSIEGEYIFFHWDPAVDSQTASPGLSYSLRIGTTPDNCDLLSPMASQSGYRLKPARGFVNSNFWKIKRSVLPDVFYWSVQAVDTSFQGSAFAPVQQVSFLPMISLVTPSSVNFGEIPVDGMSEWAEITLMNTSYADLNISSASFYNVDTQFELNYPTTGIPIEAGSTTSLFVRFAPTTVGANSDTLYIHSDAQNEPVIKIRLSGTGIHVPPCAPGNPLIVMDGDNAVISWEAVTQTIFDTPVTPDYYLVFNSTDPYGNFTYFGATNGLTLTHPLVGLFSPFMFYKVKAIKFYDREAIDLSAAGLEPGMTEEEVKMALESIYEPGIYHRDQ